MNTKERVLLYLETGISLQTVTNWDKGRRISRINAEVLAETSKKLGIDAPKFQVEAKEEAQNG